jgi:glycosyltransferase involved in cell wall biosynthesis
MPPPELAVGLVGPLPPPSGGMANQTKQLARLLAEAGVRVELVQTNAPYRPAWIEPLRGVRALFRLVPYLLALWRCAGRVDVFHVMANSGWAWHLLAAPAVWIASLRGKPAIVNYRGGEAERFLQKEFAWVRPTLSRARGVIVPSGFLRGVFGKHGVQTEIVPNIVDLMRFRPAEPRPGRLHMLVARNLEDIYDVPTALRAFARLHASHPHARLTVAGSGRRRVDLERLCADLGIADAVAFTGRVENERMADLYRDADVLLNPALVDNMPNSLLEAMASGVPIVSTNVGGVPYVVEDGRTALLVRPRDPDAVVAAVERLVTDRALALRLRETGLEEVQRYRWANVRPVLWDVYARAVGRKPIGLHAA